MCTYHHVSSRPHNLGPVRVAPFGMSWHVGELNEAHWMNKSDLKSSCLVWYLADTESSHWLQREIEFTCRGYFPIDTNYRILCVDYVRINYVSICLFVYLDVVFLQVFHGHKPRSAPIHRNVFFQHVSTCFGLQHAAKLKELALGMVVSNQESLGSAGMVLHDTAWPEMTTVIVES